MVSDMTEQKYLHPNEIRTIAVISENDDFTICLFLAFAWNRGLVWCESAASQEIFSRMSGSDSNFTSILYLETLFFDRIEQKI
jgi:hypothetical protein